MSENRALAEIGSLDDGANLEVPLLGGLGKAERFRPLIPHDKKNDLPREAPPEPNGGTTERFTLSREQLLEIYGPIDLRDELPPVRDQQETYACIAFSVAAVAEHKAQKSGEAVEIATGWLHHCLGGRPLSEVVSMSQIVNAVSGQSVPVTNLQYPDWRSTKCDREREFRFPELGRFKGEAAIMDMLGQGSVVATGMAYDKGLIAKSGPEIYQLTPGYTQYEHYVCVVGFTRTHWICRNSYGRDWRAEGYFLVRFGDCAIGEYSSCGWAQFGHFQPLPANAFA